MERQEEWMALAEKISKLLYQRRNGTLSEDGQEFLDFWIGQQDAATKEFIDKILDPVQLQKDLEYYSGIDEASAYKFVSLILWPDKI